MPTPKLNLRQALESDRLEDFIEQEEANGVGWADIEKFDKALVRIIKPPRLADQPSRSPSRDGSAET